MSVPRFAIQRPVMMTMISVVIILLGAISLTRLPVDLLPDISQPLEIHSEDIPGGMASTYADSPVPDAFSCAPTLARQ